MNERRIVVLSGVLAALLAVSYFVWKREQPEENRPSPLASVPAAAISRIDIASAGVPATTLIQKDGRWRMSAPVDDLANGSAIEPLLTMLHDFSVGSVVSESAARFDRYEVNDASATRLTVHVAGAEKPVLDILVGKATNNYSSSFVRWPGDGKVRSGDGLSSYLLRIDAARLREPALVTVPFDAIDRISGHWKGGAAEISRSSQTWTTASRKPVPAADLASIRAGFAAFRSVRFDTALPLGISDTDFTISAGTATFRLVLGVAPTERGADAVRRITVDGRPSVFFVSEAAVQKVLAALRGLR